MVARTIQQRFIRDNQIRAFYMYSRGFDFTSVATCLEEMLSDRCDILMSIGLACTIHARQCIKDADSSVLHLAVGIDPSKLSNELLQDFSPSPHFMLLGYTHLIDTLYGTLINEAKPHGKRIFAPTADAETKRFWKKDSYYYVMERELTERGWVVDIGGFATSLELQASIRRSITEYDTILLIEGMGVSSQAMIGMCSYLAYEHEKTLFVGDTANVQKGLAALGYGGDITVLIDAAEQWIRFFHREGFDAPRGEQPVIVDIPRVFAVNTSAAPYQGLDPDHIEAVARAHGGEVYTGLTGVEYPIAR